MEAKELKGEFWFNNVVKLDWDKNIKDILMEKHHGECAVVKMGGNFEQLN